MLVILIADNAAAYLVAPLLGHLAALPHRVGHGHLLGHLLAVLLGHTVTLLPVPVPTTHLQMPLVLVLLLTSAN